MTSSAADRPVARRGRGAIVAVWIATAVAVVAVTAAVAGVDVFAWLSVTLALAVVAGFVGQLIVGEQDGFVARLAAACSGAVIIVALAAVVAAARLLAA